VHRAYPFDLGEALEMYDVNFSMDYFSTRENLSATESIFSIYTQESLGVFKFKIFISFFFCVCFL
jgi:hypothetical protein